MWRYLTAEYAACAAAQGEGVITSGAEARGVTSGAEERAASLRLLVEAVVGTHPTPPPPLRIFPVRLRLPLPLPLTRT